MIRDLDLLFVYRKAPLFDFLAAKARPTEVGKRHWTFTPFLIGRPLKAART